MTQMTENTHSKMARPTFKDTPFVEITKIFNAPVERVWQAWSDQNIIKEWWGPENYTAPNAKIDFHIEGKYLLAMQAPDGQVTWSTGVYNEILPHELIVCTDQFSDENGNLISPIEAGMPGDWIGSDFCIFSAHFEKIDNSHTRLQLVHEGIPASMHDDCENGWSTSLDKLKKIVEEH